MKPTRFAGVLAGLFLVAAHCQPTSQFSIESISLSAEGVQLNWADQGQSQAYTVQSRDNLGEAIWLTVRAAQPWPISSPQWLDQRPLASGTRFYRILSVGASQRGKVLGVTSVGTYSTNTINFLLGLNGITGQNVQYGAALYKLDYETVDPWGGRTVASGLLVLPQTPTNALPLVSYQHGTIASRTEAPSGGSSIEAFVGVAFAASGYVGVVPDYLGLGDSTIFHPYHHAASEATACVDMLRAARTYCATNKVSLNGQLFLCGYSQGGHATAALQREIEAYHTNEFSITASAPMAGAYDLSGVTAADALTNALPNPYYFALILSAYQQVYHLTNSLSDLLVAPYSTTLPPLLDGSHDGSAINAAMPSFITNILLPAVLEAFEHDPSYPLRQALEDNDLYHWVPRAPTRLYHCGGDQDVVIANSLVALASFHSLGAAQVTFVEPSATLDHGDCAIPSLLLAKGWFDSLKQ